jgi:Ca-activated chloride channel family protein
MSRLNEREITRLLADRSEVEPPEGLLDKIKSEIPPNLTVAPALKEATVHPFPAAAPRRRMLLAASIAVAILGGLLGWQVLRKTETQGWSDHATLTQRWAVSPRSSAPAGPTGAPEGAIEKQAPADVEAPLPPPATVPEPQEMGSILYPGGPPPPPAPPAPRIAMKPGSPAVQPVEVEGGVAGEVEGGIAGGVPGGVISGNESGDRITVTAESPLLDERRISTGATVSEAELAKIPTAARDRADKDAPLRAGRMGLQQQKVSSTGGNAEPNDRPYGDVFFRAPGTNPFVDADEDRLSTFGLDVDTGSYTVARRYLSEGNLPDPDSVRVEEYVNFFDYGDPAPERGDFALSLEGAPTPFAPSEYRVLRLHVQARSITAEDRKPAALTFVIDVSGSMEMENRLGLVKKSLALMVNQLQPSDRIGLVVFGSDARVVLEPTSDREAVLRAIHGLATEGATNTEEGLVLGYDMADRAFRPGAINRVILCSDGVANVGDTGPDSILQRIGREARKGIELTTLGFGMGNYNDTLMEQLADKGDGRYSYIDTLDEARRVLVEELTGTLQTIARDAKAQVEFDPRAVSRWRLLGYENRDIADEKFRDDTVDAGEIGAGHGVTAVYEVKMKPGVSPALALAELRLRWKSVETGKVDEVSRTLRVVDLAPTWEQAHASLRLAAVAAQFGEILKGSYWAKGETLDQLLPLARKAASDLEGRRRATDVDELASLISKANQLAIQQSRREKQR